MKKMRNVLLLLTPSNPRRLEGIALFARTKSWHLTIADHLTHSLDGWRGDGALVTLRDDAGMLSYVRRLRRQGVCIVDLSLSRPDVRLPRVAGDNAAIGRMAAEHFKSKRYKNAAWFSTGWGHQYELRQAAFSEAMEGHCERWAWALALRKAGADDRNALSAAMGSDPIVAQWNHKHAVRRSLSSQSAHWPMQPPGQLSAVRGGRTSRRCIQFPNRQPQRLSTARVACACGRRGERTCS